MKYYIYFDELDYIYLVNKPQYVYLNGYKRGNIYTLSNIKNWCEIDPRLHFKRLHILQTRFNL